MSGLNARLCAVALRLGFCKGLANGGQMTFDFADTVLCNGDDRAKRLQAMLALNDAGVMVCASIDAQPVASHPFAAARDYRLPERKPAASAQGVRQRFGGQHVRELSDDRGRPIHFCRQLLCIAAGASGRGRGLNERDASL